MNALGLWRIVWKEYRVFRSFWLALVVLIGTIQLLVATIPSHNYNRPMALYSLAVGAAAFYALGCYGAIFSTEHDDGTYDFLRMLPISARQVYWGKILLGVLSTQALLAVLWAFAWWGARHTGLKAPNDWASVTWGLWGVATLEATAWGMLFSLLVTRPLQAVLLAVAAVSLINHLLVAFVGDGSTAAFVASAYLPTVPYRLTLALAVFLVDVWLGYRWCAQRVAAQPVSPAVRSRPGRKWRRTESAADCSSGPYRAITLTRLVWQCARHNAGLLKTLAAIVVLLSIVGAFMHQSSSNLRANRGLDTVLISGAIALLVVLAPACVFLGDQERQHFRFFTDRGVRARDIWLSRHLVWFPFTAALVGIALIVPFWREWSALAARVPAYFRGAGDVDIFNNESAMLGVLCWCLLHVFALLLTFYGVGQLCSMLIPKGILAGVLSAALCLLLGGWAMLMGVLQISWSWSLFPLPLAMLLFTRLHTRDWLLQRHGRRFWLLVVLVLAVPLAGVLVAVRSYRIHQIPDVPAGFEISTFRPAPLTAQQDAAAQLYRQAISRFAGLVDQRPPGDAPQETPEETVLRQKREQAETVERNTRSGLIEKALQASRGPMTRLVPFDREGNSLAYSSESVANVLRFAAEQLQAEGKLDEAWEHYRAALCMLQFKACLVAADFPNWQMHAETIVYADLARWAAAPQQTPERIERVLGEITELQRTLPSLLQIAERRLWLIDEDYRSDRYVKDYLGWLEWTGERQRGRRLLDYLIQRQWSTYRSIQEEVDHGRPVQEPVAEWSSGRPVSMFSLLGMSTTLLVPYQNAIEFQAYHGATDWLATETCRRAARIVLALEAFRLRHGELPNGLDQLLTRQAFQLSLQGENGRKPPTLGEYFDALPLDPYSGRWFRYFPQGIRSGTLPANAQRLATKTTFNPDQPCIWSTGGRVRYADAADKGDNSLLIQGRWAAGRGDSYAYVGGKDDDSLWIFSRENGTWTRIEPQIEPGPWECRIRFLSRPKRRRRHELGRGR